MTELHEDALVVRICEAGGIQSSGCCEGCVWHAAIQVEVIVVGDKQTFHTPRSSPLYKANLLKFKASRLFCSISGLTAA